MPDDLKEILYSLPYRKEKRFNLKIFIPIPIIAILLIFLFIFKPQNTSFYYKDINYIGPKDGDVLTPSEFSIISKENIEVYVNSLQLEPHEYDGYYVFEKKLEPGDYKIEIKKGDERKEIKIYVVDISSS
ncbi:MAG: hypothetical protein ABIL49_04475 [candidate division WOR-3 bacterium]